MERDLSACGLPLRAIQEGEGKGRGEMAEEGNRRVLVVGGSGYLGQHLLAALASDAGRLDVAFTHHSQAPPQALLDALPPSVRAFRADLRSGDGFEAISASFGQPHVVVNCAAISVPRACELDPPAAMATNVPSSLVDWLMSFGNDDSLLIHLSTDQVYEGVKSFYKEEDEVLPVNMYGKSKVAAEKFIVEKCSNYAILRSSIIYGPQTISPVAKSLPVQYILLHENYQLYVLPKVLESKKLAKSGRTKQKEADLEYNVAKQVEKMLALTCLQVLALHRVFLHSTRPTPRSRKRGLHRRRPTRRGRGRRRSGGLARPTGTTTRRRGQGGLRRSHSHNLSQGGVRWSKVGALGPLGTAPGPLGTAPRARYL